MREVIIFDLINYSIIVSETKEAWKSAEKYENARQYELRNIRWFPQKNGELVEKKNVMFAYERNRLVRVYAYVKENAKDQGTFFSPRDFYVARLYMNLFYNQANHPFWENRNDSLRSLYKKYGHGYVDMAILKTLEYCRNYKVVPERKYG